MFAWTGPKEDNQDIYVKLVNVEPPLRLTTDPAIDGRPRWSPDGKQIAFIRGIGSDEMAVILISPLGGPERRVGHLYVASDNGYRLTSDSRCRRTAVSSCSRRSTMPART